MYMKLLRKGPVQFCDLVECRSWKFEASKTLEHRKGIACAGHCKCWSNNDTLAQGSSALSFVLFSSVPYTDHTLTRRYGAKFDPNILSP
jgi:hypothetical protein